MPTSRTGAGIRGTAFAGPSLVELLRFRAAVQPDDRAYTFLRDGESEGTVLTYGDLDRRSRAIAADLQDRVPPGARALLLYPPGLDFIAAFFGCLYAQVIAVPAHPPHAERSNSSFARLAAIATDADPAAVLTTGEILSRWPRDAGRLPRALSATDADTWSSGLTWLATDTVSDDVAEAWRDPGADRRTLALLQYTSGSTASPKGVMVSHGNLLHNLAYAFHLEENHASSVFVSWLPVLHDMGLIEGVLQPAFSGCPAYLMAPVAFLQRPARWLEAISRYRATRSGGPNFAYDLSVRKISREERAGLDLRTWRAAYNGAEPIRRDTLDAFASTFADRGFRPSAFRPCYGLAEATLVVTSGHWDATPPRETSPASRPVSCGAPAFGARVAIVYPNTGHRAESGEVGEIWVASPSVAQGYWNRPEESARTFHAHTSDGDGPFLRTGDLGFVDEGELYVTGRLKEVLIVRGCKHYPQDLEHTAQRQHPMIHPGGAAAVGLGSGPSGDRIALVAEVDTEQLAKPRAADVVIAAIRRAVAEQHGVQLHAVVLVAPRTIPKTTSGKLQRLKCRDAFLAGTMPVLAVWRAVADA
jgi:acyl-CoA synthetase (AMP-forming)/AMP-acid ligase II